tara:strand:+ start:583 stop:1425 length:843 start_codon:yes stop_codon:yes gene_type:complete
MGYLNNTTRTLDAILTKRGREILSGGGTFNVTKFALGDDEIDYGLWDTTHTKGTDFYGAVIENLPALEPYNDPSEIMKYKLVTRTEGTKNMPFIRQSAGTLELSDINVPYNPTLKYQCDIPEGGVVWIGEPQNLGQWQTFIDPETTGTPIPAEWGGLISNNGILFEAYTVTLLDVSVGILGPNIYQTGDEADVAKFSSGNWALNSGKFLNEQKNLSQTIPNVSFNGGLLQSLGEPDALKIYPKQTETRYTSTDPIKTKLLITGLITGAVKEVNVNIYYQT